MNLKELTFAELLALAADVDVEKVTRIRERSAVADRYGIILPVSPNGASAHPARKVYADPKTGARYTAGIGRPPNWLMKVRNRAALEVK